jgi:hypothetical protein
MNTNRIYTDAELGLDETDVMESDTDLAELADLDLTEPTDTVVDDSDEVAGLDEDFAARTDFDAEFAAVTAAPAPVAVKTGLASYLKQHLADVDALPTYRPVIGCIIPAYNEAESIESVLRSLLKQTRLPDAIHAGDLPPALCHRDRLAAGAASRVQGASRRAGRDHFREGTVVTVGLPRCESEAVEERVRTGHDIFPSVTLP